MAKRFKHSCDYCEWNLDDLTGETWCAKHDIDKLPLFGCGDWRPNLTAPQEGAAEIEERRNT